MDVKFAKWNLRFDNLLKLFFLIKSSIYPKHMKYLMF